MKNVLMRLCSAALVACTSLFCQTVTLSDVQGLPQALALRPTAGEGMAPGRTAVINSSGAIDGAVGNLSDCVHVDGTSGPCSSTTTGVQSFYDNEVPTGLINGNNASFALSATPTGSSLALYRNGLLMKAGADYDLSANIATFRPCCIPNGGDMLSATYRGSIATGRGGMSLGHTLVNRSVDTRFFSQLVSEQARRDSQLPSKNTAPASPAVRMPRVRSPGIAQRIEPTPRSIKLIADRLLKEAAVISDQSNSDTTENITINDNSDRTVVRSNDDVPLPPSIRLAQKMRQQQQGRGQ